MPSHHVTGLGSVSHQSPALSSWDTHSAQATAIPSACSLPLSEELLGKGKAGSWPEISSAERSPGATLAVSVIRMSSYSSFFSAPCSRFQCFTISCLPAQLSVGDPSHPARTAPNAIPTFWRNAAAGWEGSQAHPKSSLNYSEPRAKGLQESKQGRLLASQTTMESCH